MDYYLYNWTGQHAGTFPSEKAAREMAIKLHTEWLEVGRVLHYRVCYNGVRSVEVFNTRELGKVG